jgi:hypothetical protein
VLLGVSVAGATQCKLRKIAELPVTMDGMQPLVMDEGRKVGITP